MTPLVDTHFHYPGTPSPQEYCRELSPAYHWKLLAVGGGLAESRAARDFAHAIPGARFAAGVHPHGAEEFDGDFAAFHEFRDDPKLAAVGEIGLDFFYDHAPRQRQRQVFAAFLEVALAWRLPAIVHCRDAEATDGAYRDVHALLRDFAADSGRFAVHCFSGTPAWAEEFLALGGYLGVTGMVTFNKATNIRDNLKSIPLDRLLLETDAPYLAPIPFRGRENHPQYLPAILERTAREYGVAPDQLARITAANANTLFGI